MGFNSHVLIFKGLINNFCQKPVKMTKKLLLTFTLKMNMIFKNKIIFHGIYKMDLHMELKDGLSSKIFPFITVVIGVYFYRVCHWGPCTPSDFKRHCAVKLDFYEPIMAISRHCKIIYTCLVVPYVIFNPFFPFQSYESGSVAVQSSSARAEREAHYASRKYIHIRYSF